MFDISIIVRPAERGSLRSRLPWYRWWIITARSNVGDHAHDRSEKNSSRCYPPCGTVSVSNRSDAPCLYSTIFLPNIAPIESTNFSFLSFFFPSWDIHSEKATSNEISEDISEDIYGHPTTIIWANSLKVYLVTLSHVDQTVHTFNINSANSTRWSCAIDRDWAYNCPSAFYLLGDEVLDFVEGVLGDRFRSLRRFSREDATTIVNVTVSHALFTLQHLYIFMYVYYRL